MGVTKSEILIEGGGAIIVILAASATERVVCLVRHAESDYFCVVSSLC